MRLIAEIVAGTCIALAGIAGLTSSAHAASDSSAIPWVKDYAEAKKQAESSKRPMIVYWTNALLSERKFAPKMTPEQYTERNRATLAKPSILAKAQDFVWVQIDFKKDADAIKELGIAENLAKTNDLAKPPAPQGFVFARADGKVYGRTYWPLEPTLVDMMEGVLKAHSPMDSAIRKIPYKTEFSKYKPYKVPYRGRPKQLEFPPHTQTWRECPKCREALGKAMTFLKSKPDRGWLGNFFAGFAFMMAEGCEKELAQSISTARGHCKPVWGGYSNWGISQSMLLVAEYSIRYGLTAENRAALITAQQYAAEQVDDGGGWFHHPKQGGVNYAWDISPIGAMYYPALLEMEALGLEAQPSLTLARGYLERLSDGWSIGYGTPFTSGLWGSVGKNGFVLMGFYATGKQNEPFARMLGDFLTDNPEAPPKGHGTSWHHFFGAGMGDHLMGPAHYAKYAGYWLHPLIDCQKSDGSIAPLPHDDAEARAGVPPDKVLEDVKNSDKHDYAATAILACLILMTEPGAYSPKPMVKPMLTAGQSANPIPGVKKPQPATTAKAEDVGTKPTTEKPPVKRSVAPPAAVAEWDAKLKARAGALAKEGTRLVCEHKASGERLTILSIVDDAVNVRMANGGQIDLRWPWFEPVDRLNLALSIVNAKDTPEDHALAAFYLLVDGNVEKADRHLLKAGDQAAEVRVAFKNDP